MNIDANPVPGPAHVAFNHVACSERACDFAHVHVLPAKGKRGVLGNNQEFTEAGQLGDYVLRDAITEINLIRVVTQVLEGQNGDRRFLAQERFWRFPSLVAFSAS